MYRVQSQCTAQLNAATERTILTGEIQLYPIKCVKHKIRIVIERDMSQTSRMSKQSTAI